MNTNNTITLSDGRQLAYAEYGQADGFPIFGLHGTPGSRLWFAKEDENLTSLGIRFITTDRPGYGLSDQKPKRSILDFCDDLIELADHLGIVRFSVVGISGGGVYSAACAYKYPMRVIKAGLVSTVDEFENGRPPKGMTLANKMAFLLGRNLPWLLRYHFGQQKKMMDRKPDVYKEVISKNVRHLCPADQAVMAQVGIGEEMHMHMQEAFRLGVKGAVYECKLMTYPWGFDPGEIKVPVELWHGTADTLAPIDSAKQLAQKIPNCQGHYIEEKGHFLSEEQQYWRSILESLKA